MPNFDRIINLIKKTGDKVIVVNENGDPDYVIMRFNDYEKMSLGGGEVADLTEDEFLDKINRDIAIWKNAQKVVNFPAEQHDFSQNLAEISSFGQRFYENKKKSETSDIEEKYYFEPVE